MTLIGILHILYTNHHVGDFRPAIRTSHCRSRQNPILFHYDVQYLKSVCHWGKKPVIPNVDSILHLGLSYFPHPNIQSFHCTSS